MPENQALQADDCPIAAQQWIKGHALILPICAMQENGR